MDVLSDCENYKPEYTPYTPVTRLSHALLHAFKARFYAIYTPTRHFYQFIYTEKLNILINR